MEIENLSRPKETQTDLADIQIREVKNSRGLQEFLSLPRHIYTDPNTKYIQPLNLHMKMMMGKLQAPEKHFFLAYNKQGQPVARMGFKVHRHGKKPILHFGFFECKEGYPQAARALLQRGRSLYPQLDLMGPFHFRMEDPYIGVLVEGYDRDPYFLMPYNPPYYDTYLHDAGLTKVMDLFTYEIDEEASSSLSPLIAENATKAEEKGVSIRFMNPKKLRDEARVIAEIFNDALSKNWGFEEFIEEQVEEMVTMFKLFIDPRVVALAQVDGKDVGCLLMIPNYNPLIKSGRGRITPKLVFDYFTKRRKLGSIRGYALGVKKAYHNMGIGSALTAALWKHGPPIGYVRGEISWILSNNGPMNELTKAMGGRHNKVYRIYEAKGHTP